ncbi:MAG TPA: DUF3575 domain-containing protein [Petrimonas sp.]|uniref:DUF3575 domain-containing protein n=1 Tax=Petrimonas sp. TaxID=2023866 RepID=UPI00177870DF|nr:DUF3575 domain-containing protein [Petrimonas sp.]
MIRHLLILLVVLFAINIPAVCQDKVAVKTNLLYGIPSLTPNLGIEFGLGQKTSFEVFGSYNAWNVKGSEINNQKLAHWFVGPEFRYWFCERFNGHFTGIHGLYGEYNISGHDIPVFFNGKIHKEYRYQGNMIGVGISYGYEMILSKRFNLEFEIGAGYNYLKYDQFECKKCGDKLSSEVENYFGPTKAAITLIYLIK